MHVSAEGSGVAVRVCHLTSVHAADDIRVVRKELLTLAGEGYEVHLVAPHSGRQMFEQIVYHFVSPPSSRLARFWRVRREVFSMASLVDADIYHCHDIEMLALAVQLQAQGARVIYDAHEDVRADVYDKEWVPSYIRPILSHTIGYWEDHWASRADAIIAATPAIARRFDSAHATVVQNFPLIDELTPAAAKPMHLRDMAVVYAGALSAVRGLSQMLSAADLLSDSGINLLLAGAFVSPHDEQLARGASGWKKVAYKGLLERSALGTVFGDVRAGLVVLQPARNHVEAQPNKLFEYMSAGLPVVASHFPLWRQIVEGNGCGLCVDPTRPAEIAAAVKWLCENPEEAAAMGRRGLQAVRSRYSWSVERESLLRVYSRLSARNPAKSGA